MLVSVNIVVWISQSIIIKHLRMRCFEWRRICAETRETPLSLLYVYSSLLFRTKLSAFTAVKQFLTTALFRFELVQPLLCHFELSSLDSDQNQSIDFAVRTVTSTVFWRHTESSPFKPSHCRHPTHTELENNRRKWTALMSKVLTFTFSEHTYIKCAHWWTNL